MRESSGFPCLQRGDPGLGLKVGRILRKKQYICMLIDQDTKVPSIFVPFFGKDASTPIGAALFSAKFKVPVFISTIHRKPDGKPGHEVYISDLIPAAEDSEEGIRQATALYTKLLEQQIREHPTEWVWMHRRWKTKSDSRN